jgi:hypothetical protein
VRLGRVVGQAEVTLGRMVPIGGMTPENRPTTAIRRASSQQIEGRLPGFVLSRPAGARRVNITRPDQDPTTRSR